MREQHPAIGWIRADLIPTTARADEVLKLKEENERLTEHIYRLGLQEPDTLASLASGEDLFDIQYFFSRMKKSPETGTFRRADIHDGVLSMSWNDIFAIIGPSLIESDPQWSVPKVLLPIIERRVMAKLRRQWPDNRFQRFLISSTDSDAILLQLRALKLITSDERKGWCLTPYGDNYMARLLAVPKGERKR